MLSDFCVRGAECTVLSLVSFTGGRQQVIFLGGWPWHTKVQSRVFSDCRWSPRTVTKGIMVSSCLFSLLWTLVVCMHAYMSRVTHPSVYLPNRFIHHPDQTIAIRTKRGSFKMRNWAVWSRHNSLAMCTRMRFGFCHKLPRVQDMMWCGYWCLVCSKKTNENWWNMLMHGFENEIRWQG